MRQLIGVFAAGLAQIRQLIPLIVIEESQREALILFDQWIGMPLRADIHCDDSLVPQPSHLYPVDGHAVDLAFIGNGQDGPVVVDHRNQILIQLFNLNFFHLLTSFSIVFPRL